MIKKTLSIITLLASLLVIGPAHAIATLFDFTQAGNYDSLTVDGITVTLTPNGGSLNNSQGYDGGGAGLCISSPLSCVTDGFGIGDDEITYYPNTGQYIFAGFSSAVDVSGIHLLDLFGDGDDGGTNNAEVAQMWFLTSSGNPQYSLTGSNTPGGYAYFDQVINDVLGIYFFTADFNEGDCAECYTLSPSNSDFALAGIQIVAVPEPKSIALLGIGLLGIGFIMYRRKKS